MLIVRGQQHPHQCAHPRIAATRQHLQVALAHPEPFDWLGNVPAELRPRGAVVLPHDGSLVLDAVLVEAWLHLHCSCGVSELTDPHEVDDVAVEETPRRVSITRVVRLIIVEVPRHVRVKDIILSIKDQLN